MNLIPIQQFPRQFAFRPFTPRVLEVYYRAFPAGPFVFLPDGSEVGAECGPDYPYDPRDLSLNVTSGVPIWRNQAFTQTMMCADNPAIVVEETICQNTFYSTESQEAVDELTRQAANEKCLQALLRQGCTTGVFFNSAQSYTAHCPVGYIGTPVTASVPAQSYFSSVSQADADAQALAAATAEAQQELVCVKNPAPTIIVEPQNATIGQGDSITLTVEAI